MPPKPTSSGASKKTIEKEKQKKIEDKTFGLKNKNKSKKVGEYVKQVEKQATNNANAKKANHKAEIAKKDRELAEKARKEVDEMLKPTIVQPKVPLGVDPKSIVCELFKHGQCTKGNKCRFSHDLQVGRKDAKLDIYTDRRTAAPNPNADTMDNWDEEKLKSVVDKKQTAENKKLRTTIVCKYFLEAIEKAKYGWFWECPNGGDKCMYQHCLPPGFVLQKKKTTKDEEEEEIPLEEIIEAERAKLTKTTPVTLETFTKWKEQKRIQKEIAAKEAEEKRLADIKAGKTSMSGKDLFVFNPDLFVDDDEAIDVQGSEYERQPEENIAEEINKSLFIGGDDEDLDDLPDDDEEEEEEEEEDQNEEEEEEDE